jgi:hypothetical protein
MLTYAHLCENFHYSIITGQFYWLKTKARRNLSKEAGSIDNTGYRQIRINRTRYISHRLAWFWVTGEWPKHQIDHKNGIRDANYWLNLREATPSQNQHNQEKRKNNTSGFKGVCWNKVSQKWQASIMINRKNRTLGRFDDIELAYEARLKLFQANQ